MKEGKLLASECLQIFNVTTLKIPNSDTQTFTFAEPTRGLPAFPGHHFSPPCTTKTLLLSCDKRATESNNHRYHNGLALTHGSPNRWWRLLGVVSHTQAKLWRREILARKPGFERMFHNQRMNRKQMALDLSPRLRQLNPNKARNISLAGQVPRTGRWQADLYGERSCKYLDQCRISHSKDPKANCARGRNHRRADGCGRDSVVVAMYVLLSGDMSKPC